jgi:hypothetical protein
VVVVGGQTESFPGSRLSLSPHSLREFFDCLFDKHSNGFDGLKRVTFKSDKWDGDESSEKLCRDDDTFRNLFFTVKNLHKISPTGFAPKPRMDQQAIC